MDMRMNWKPCCSHSAFLEAFGEDRGDPELNRVLNFFWKLPLWLELLVLRAVHACWHVESMASIKPFLGSGNTLTRKLLVAASKPGSKFYEAFEAILKWLDHRLPAGYGFRDEDDEWRTSVGIKWWNSSALPFDEISFNPVAWLTD